MAQEQRITHFLSWYEDNESKYKEFAKCILEKVLKALEDRSMLHAYHTYRAKSLSSLTEKCNKKRYDEGTNSYVLKYNDPRNQITDLAGARIVCYLPQDIMPIQHIIENMFYIDAVNSMNKADLLQSNKVGYLSVHYVVSLKKETLSTELRKYSDMKCEIQLRTVLQDAWSQVFHDRQYKSNGRKVDITPEMRRATNLISGALELIDNEIGHLVKRYDSMVERMDNVAYQELLDRIIDKENLEKYFKIKFAHIGLRFYNYDNISKVLGKFGLLTIRDVDATLDDGLTQAICTINRQLTIDKILMYGMIVNNANKFFDMEENKEVSITHNAYNVLDMFVDMKDICSKYNLIMEG